MMHWGSFGGAFQRQRAAGCGDNTPGKASGKVPSLVWHLVFFSLSVMKCSVSIQGPFTLEDSLGPNSCTDFDEL